MLCQALARYRHRNVYRHDRPKVPGCSIFMLLGGKQGIGVTEHFIELKVSPPEEGEETCSLPRSTHSNVNRTSLECK